MTLPPHEMPMADPPSPPLDELQQDEPAELASVPVHVHGPVRVQQPPAKAGPAFATTLDTTVVQILGRQLQRSKATLVCDAAWQYRWRRNSQAVRVPADVMLVITHADEVWASVSTGSGDLSVITEIYAD